MVEKCPLVIVIGSYCCAPVNSNFEENYFTLSDEKRVLFTYQHIFSGGEVTLKNAIMLRIPLLYASTFLLKVSNLIESF